jgi:hypothetical protein
MDVVFLLLVFLFGMSMLWLIAACRRLEERGHGR